MFPILIDLGTWTLPLVGEVHVHLPTYGTLFAGSALLAWWWFMARGRSMGLPSDKLFNAAFYSLLGGVVGAKLGLIVMDWRYYLGDLQALLGTLRSAGVLITGLACSAAVFIIYSNRHGLPTRRLGDAIAAPLALGQAVGRLGCFSAGCCYGVEVEAGNPIGITFTDPNANTFTGVPLNRPLVPTQLIEMSADLVLVGVLTWLWRRRPEPPGTVFWWYMILYGVARGIIEFWRGDVDRGLFFGGAVSTSQILSLLAVALGAFVLVRGRLRRAREASG